MDQPDAAMEAAKSLVLDDLPPIVGAEMAWALASIHGDAGRTAEAVAVAEAGYEIAIRCSDAPHMRFNIADCACRCAGAGGSNQRGGGGGGMGAAAKPRTYRGRRTCWGRRSQVVRRWARGGWMRRALCWNGRRGRCRRRAMSRVGGIGTESRVRRRWRCRAGGTMRLRCWKSSKRCDARSGSWTTRRAWQGRGWLRDRVRSARRSGYCGRRRRGRRQPSDSRRKWCACRRRRSSAIGRASRGCGSSKGWSRDRESASRRGSPGRCTMTSS